MSGALDSGVSDADAAMAQAECGDLSSLQRVRVSGEAVLAIATARWFYGLTPHPPLGLRPHELCEHLAQCSGPAIPAAAHALGLVSRIAWLLPDISLLQACCEGLVKLKGATDDERVHLIARSHALWRSLLDETNLEKVSAQSTALQADAAAKRNTSMVLEATILRATAALANGDLAEAQTVARRGSRMARTEAMPPWEWPTNIVLARVRRHQGRAHLALRIASALAPRVSWPFRGWLAWELLLAGDAEAATLLVENQPTTGFCAAVRAGVALLTEAQAGDVISFDVQASVLRKTCAEVPLIAPEAAALIACIDLRAQACQVVNAWRSGLTDTCPFGLHGVVREFVGSGQRAVAFAIAANAEGNGGRVLAPGVDLQRMQELGVAPDEDSGGPRGEAALACLALAPAEGFKAEDLFRRIYGFAYVPSIHGGTFRVLLHRVRRRLGSQGEIVREGERLWLRSPQALAVPDPRCARPIGDRLLGYLAANRGVSAEQAARALGIPLRSVQALLRQLIDDGICRHQRAGRQISYVVEDTTFSDPTDLNVPRSPQSP